MTRPNPLRAIITCSFVWNDFVLLFEVERLDVRALRLSGDARKKVRPRGTGDRAADAENRADLVISAAEALRFSAVGDVLSAAAKFLTVG